MFAITSIISCEDPCRFVEPSTVCGSQLEFEILNNKDYNIFLEDYSIDSLQIMDSFNTPISFTIDTNDYTSNTFQFGIFDCATEREKFNTTITKNYFLQLSSTVVDTLSIEFKPNDAASECGGSSFDFIRITYHDQVYAGYPNSVIKIYR